MIHVKTVQLNLVSAMRSGKIEQLKALYAKLLSEGNVKEVREVVSALYGESSPSCHTLLYAMTEEYVLLNNYYSLCPFLSFLAERIGERELSLFWKRVYRETFSSGKENLPAPVSGEFYAYEYEGVYESEGKKYPLRVASFSREIGKNMTALITRYGVLLFDCGSGALREGSDEIEREELKSFFERNGFSSADVVGVFLSHAHLDHYGSSGILPNVGIPESKVFADPITLKIMRRQMPELPFFNFHAQFFHPKIKVEPFFNGHILGSCGYVVSFDRQNIVYTGDFSLHDQKTVEGVKSKEILRLGSIFRHGVSLLITESTYGREEDELTYADYKKLFSYFDSRLKKWKIRKFFPAFAVGRSQEVLLNLSKGERVLLGGASVSLTELYEKQLKRSLSKGNVRRGEGNDRFDALICSSGMLAKESASYRYAVKFENEELPTAMILSGYMAREGYGYEVMREWVKAGKTLLKIPLSAHADRRELLTLIDEIKPKKVLTVHGDGISGAKYRNEEIFSLKKEERKAEGGETRTPDEIGRENYLAFLEELSRINEIPLEKNDRYQSEKKKS